MTDQLIYLDHAAATPMDPRVLRAMQPYQTEAYFNPSASYLPATKVRHELDQARERLASWLGAKPSEIVFTAGATEANNLAIRGVMERYPASNLIVSAIEHESVLEPAKLYKCKLARVGSDGRVDLTKLRRQIDDQTVLISVMQANNEIGTIQPIKDIARLIKEVLNQRTSELPLLLHTDSAQAANYLDLHVARLGVDLMSLNGGKIYGPKQSGLLFVKSSVRLQPQISGGGQERGLRSGTENVAGDIGLSIALDLTQTMRGRESQRLGKLQQDFLSDLNQAVKGITINGSLKHRLPNNVHLTIDGADNERLIMELDQAGILAAAGSACSASSDEPSHVLKAIGKTDEQARSSLRLTLGRSTTAKQLKQTADLLASLSLAP